MQVAPLDGHTPRHTAPVVAKSMSVHSPRDCDPGTPVSAAQFAADAMDADMAGVTPLAENQEQDSVIAGTTPGQIPGHDCAALPPQSVVRADGVYEGTSELRPEQMPTSVSDADVPMLSPEDDLAPEDCLEDGARVNHDADMHSLPSQPPYPAQTDITLDHTAVTDVPPPSHATQELADNRTPQASAFSPSD